MRILKTLSVLMLALLLVFSLASCGGNNSNGGSGDNNGNSGSGSNGDFSKQVVKDDRALLEEHNYEVKTYYATVYDLSFAESQINAKEATLQAYLYGYDNDGHGIYIYYLSTEKDAKDCYDSQSDSLKAAYKLRGNKLFTQDTTGLFD